MWAPLLPSSHPIEPRPKEPAQSHALVPPTFSPSYTPPRNFNPSPLFYPSIPSLFPLIFSSFSIVLLCFDSIFASFYPLFHSPQNARRRTDQGGIEPHRHPIATWYISLKIDPKSTTVATPIIGGEVPQNGPFCSHRPQTPYSHFVRNEQLRHAWQLAFVTSSYIIVHHRTSQYIVVHRSTS